MIECDNCGANLTLDDEKCPYCDAPNPDAILHVQQMKLYKEKYEKINAHILNQTQGNNIRKLQTTIALTLAGVCFVALILGVIIEENARNINSLKYRAFKYSHFKETIYSLKNECLPYRIYSYNDNVKTDSITDEDLYITVKKTNRYINTMERIRALNINKSDLADAIVSYNSIEWDVDDLYFEELDDNLINSLMYYYNFTREQATDLIGCEVKEEAKDILETITDEK